MQQAALNGETVPTYYPFVNADYKLIERYDLRMVLFIVGGTSVGLILLVGLCLLVSVRLLAKYKVNELKEKWEKQTI